MVNREYPAADVVAVVTVAVDVVAMRILFLFLAPLYLLACGGSTEDVEIKEYRLTALTDENMFADKFRSLVAAFNKRSGFEALTYVESAEQANSAIIITRGLKERDGKVGWGQWMTETDEPNKFDFSGSKTRTVHYSMRVEFDQEYFQTRLNSPTKSEQQYELEKLFFHEVGHGLQMDHDSDPQNVMFADISGPKDFNGYFLRVRSFFGK